MPLNEKSVAFMIQLNAARLEAEEAGNPGVAWRPLPTGENPQHFSALVRYKYVDKRHDLYRLTRTGEQILQQDDPQEPQTNIIPVMAGSEIPPPSVIVAPEASCSNACDSCIYRQALEIIAARMPEAAELTLVLNKLNVRLS